MSLTAQLLLILLLPFAGIVISGLMGRRMPAAIGGWMSTLFVAVSCLLAFQVASGYFFGNGKSGEAFTAQLPFSLDWLNLGNSGWIRLILYLDPISAMMLVVVTLVSLMVHLFSIGYLKGENRYATYFGYLGLFTFSMLGLVLSGNIFQIYIFWELVGVSSFLLIGFYYDRPSAVAAAKKAFIVTRFADLGFLIGILVLAYHAGTYDFRELIARLTDTSSPYLSSAITASFLGLSALTWGLLLVFMGGAGKSAMFPLHIWLPDAMEGPTPVSALIHAATMVVAGVFLVARLFPVFAISCPAALEVVAWTGALSSLFAAVVACTQTDIKRVLAYSTMSQIGYMLFSLGVSGYGGEEGAGFVASQFHLFTHALFKALLFLVAGVVIHAVHTNEMSGMGGLRKAMPFANAAFLIGCLAIAGIPPFSGFFSKEAILHAAHATHPAIYWLGLGTAGLTAFYMFRLYYRIFWNRPADPHLHPHGGGVTEYLPLVILAAGAVFDGLIPFGEYVSSDGRVFALHTDWAFSVLPLTLSIGGILIATWMYLKQNERSDRAAAFFAGFYRAARSKFFLDELYGFVTKKIIFRFIGAPAAWIDRSIVDGAVNTMGVAAETGSESLSELQNGRLQTYGAWMVAGVFVLLLITFYYLK